MRLLVLALTAIALAQPALARERGRHHYRAHAVHSYRHLVRSHVPHHAWRSAVAWRHHHRLVRVRVVEQNDGQGRVVPNQPSSFAERNSGHGELDAMIARHAQMNGLPEALVHRVVIRESGYNAHVVGAGGAIGLMQIKYSTAREMGYGGTAAGLLDPETNLTYAVRYLAGAYRVAGGNADRAVANYAHGYRDTTEREGGAPYRRVASSETSAWSGSYASAGPTERVALLRTPPRYHSHRRLMRWR